ncbi:MAG TPA: metallophosphoesterase, partial [Kofleriaceae bacterium]
MTTYAIGDIQGCKATLDRLLAAIDYSPSRDRLWLVGDLVNRGPASLDVLRWAIAQGSAVTTVLGNHDLHLLARIAGVAPEKKRDT